jgi:hypothetical protein
MADDDSTAKGRCPNCGQAVPEAELRVCQMCRSLFCQHCEVYGYGRFFCGERCRDTFFFGDGEDSREDF